MFVFGYFSLIQDLPTLNKTSTVIPAVLRGWKRTWSAHRRDGYPFPKRYVDAGTYAVIPEYAFGSIAPSRAEDFVNGIITQVDDARIGEYDFREHGYDRINVKQWCTTYDGTPFPHDVFAYIDRGQTRPDPVDRISFLYLNMGIAGARVIETIQPGFLRDFLTSTPLPSGGVFPWKFLFIGLDGKSVWILDELNCRQTCILVLKAPFEESFAPSMRPEDSPEWQIPPAKDLAFYDVRTPLQTPPEGTERHPVLDTVRDALSASDPAPFATHSHWLVRLACLGRQDAAEIAPALVDDSDAWVRGCAMGVQRGAGG
jgi:hypothetical protein